MAKKEPTGNKKYQITVTANPDFCGLDACGVQFSHGKAETDDPRAAAWFQEHDGYAVSAVEEQAAPEA